MDFLPFHKFTFPPRNGKSRQKAKAADGDGLLGGFKANGGGWSIGKGKWEEGGNETVGRLPTPKQHTLCEAKKEREREGELAKA
jgi:hypothetical protein